MPSTSPKQAKFMAAAAHNPKFAKKADIPQKVAKEFNQADKGRTEAFCAFMENTEDELGQNRSKEDFEKSRVGWRKGIKRIRSIDIGLKHPKDPAAQRVAHQQLDKDFSDVVENFCAFLEGYLDNNARRSVYNTIKSIKTSRAIDMKRQRTPSDIETEVSHQLRTNADKYSSGSKPWDPQDREIEDHYHNLASKRQGLADKLKIQGK